MAWSASVFIIVFLYAECSGKLVRPSHPGLVTANDTVYLSRGSNKAIHIGPPPVYWDWRDERMVSPVKNQLGCNACWAFSIIGSIESHVKIYRGEEVTLSEQYLIDCNDVNAGCGSASLVQIYGDIVSRLGGVYKDQDYFPYSGTKKICKTINQPKPIPVVGFKRVYPNEDEMAKYVYHYGPLSVGINSASMAKYTNGIDQPTEDDCPPDELNHAVLIVGYNLYISEDGKQRIPYWIIKNSWGTEWGDKGFYYLERGRNACGIASDPSFPFVK